MSGLGLLCQFSVLALALLIGMAAPEPAPQRYIQTQQHQYQQQQQQQQAQTQPQLLDIVTPESFNYNSPLREPDSLRSKPYYDFLSTLYRRDSDKSNLLRPYSRRRRDVDSVVSAEERKLVRPRRALVFRPLFVYKQQEVRKQELRARRRSTKV